MGIPVMKLRIQHRIKAESPPSKDCDRLTEHNLDADVLQRAGEFSSPHEALKAQAAARPDALFLLAPASAELPYAPEGFAYRYGEALAQIDGLRAAYAAAGYGCG